MNNKIAIATATVLVAEVVSAAGALLICVSSPAGVKLPACANPVGIGTQFLARATALFTYMADPSGVRERQRQHAPGYPSMPLPP